MHYYQHHIGDYAFATSHLSVEEDCAYRRMLDLYYDTESPIPNDPAFVAKRIRMLSHVETVKALLNEFFSLQEDGWHSSRADAEIASYKRMQDGGRNGANKRWSKAGDSHPIATLSPPQSPPQANPNSNQEPRTKNKEPNNSVPKGTGEKPPKVTDPDEIIFGYGVPLLTNSGTAEKQARSFLGGLRKHHGDEALICKLRECMKTKPLQPLEWLAAALPPKAKASRHAGFDDIDYRAGVGSDGRF